MNQKVRNKTVSVVIATAAVVAGIAVVALTCKKRIGAQSGCRGTRR